MARRFQLVSELADQTARNVTRDVGAWKQYLDTASRLYKYKFDEQLLIYAQRPDATACAEMEVWNEKMRRWVKGGSKGIALIRGVENGRPHLEYVFDVADTRPVRGARMPYLWEMRKEHHAPVLAALEKRYGEGSQKELGSRLMEIAAKAVMEVYPEYLRELAYDAEGSFLEELDQLNLEVCFRDTLTASVQYTLLARCGLAPSDYLDDEELAGITEFSTPAVLHHLGDAASTLSMGVLQEIGRTIWNYDRERMAERQKNIRKAAEKPLAKSEGMGYTKATEQFNTLKHESEERSIDHGGTDIQEERGLSDTGADAGRGGRTGGNANREVRDAAADLSHGEPSRDVHIHAADGTAGAPPAADRRAGTGAGRPDSGRNDETAGSGREPERARPDGMGAGGEQPDGTGGGSSASGDRLQVGKEKQEEGKEQETAGENPAVSAPAYFQMSLFPTVEEQAERIAQAKAEEKTKDSSARGKKPVPEVQKGVIGRALTSGGNEKNSTMRITAFYQKSPSVREAAAFLQKEYGTGGKGLTVAGEKYALWFDKEGIKIAPGRTAHIPGASLVTWEQAAEQVSELLEEGIYAAQETLDITPSAAQIKNGSNEDVTANYDIVYETGKLTVFYMEPPAALLYNDDIAKGWYSGDVVITAAGYTVSDTLGGEYKDSYTISAQEGTVTKTLYFKDAAGHMSGGVEVMVKFDLTPPTGEIAVGAKWWQNVLHFISFGNYAAKEYTVTIKAEDKKGSGISKIEYAIVTGTDQYTDADTLKAANLNWTEYNSGSQPTVPVSNSQYVVYARLTDNVGNVTYISTDGILLDNTPPTVGSLSVPEDTRKDVTAGFTFTVSEAADYYYVVLPESSAAPSAEDIIVTCGGTLPEGAETAISGTFPKGSGAVSADTPGVSVDVKNLSPNTAYTVYVTAVDRAVDITDSAEGTPAGNIAAVQNVDFTTKKTLPVITKAPAVAGTYGQSVGEMTVTGGTAQAGSTVLVGTWTVSDADKNEKPSAGTSEVTVIFKPDNANYDSVSVQASLTVSQRNLNAEGVTVSEVAGTYTYTGSEIRPPVAVDTGTPAAGIYISDSGAALTANDFTVSYSNHKDAGTASVTITGKGNYTGSVTKTFTIGKASGREVPDVSGSYTDNGQTYTYTVTPTEGAVYCMGNDGKWQEENVFEGITPGTSVTFYAKMPETGNYEEGTPKYITVDFPKLTPAAPALTYKADRTNPADVKVTITPVSGAEYSFDGGKTWTESNEQGGFTTSDTVTLAIRLKGTDTHNPSPVQTVTVNLAKKDREAPPAFSLKVEANGETDYTVTIPPTEGCEYSFDGETWTDSNVKTGVSIGETVTGYKRYKETNDYNASSAVSAKETMPKFTVKTPVISPAGGSYTGSVSVTITCGSTDAEIYYTTDGSTPGRSSARYTGAFTVTVPATVKAVAIKDGLDDSAVATASYTKKDGGGSGGNGGGGNGNSGGNENNSGSGGNDEGQGSGGNGSTNPGNGNTTPQPSVTQPTDTNANPGNGANPGTGTTPVNPGNGNTSRPGAGSGSGTGTPAQGTKQPFIKGADGKIGWDVIRAEEEQAQEGSTINVDMNGSVVVPGDIFDSIKGKDITITFDMGNGILWSVDGKSITTEKAGDIDFSVKTGVNTVPVDIVNNVTGESYSIQISLAYEGDFGFTAVLSIGLGKENAGYTASLYYYNESTGELEFICSDEVAEDGTVSLAFTHASDYVIAIDGDGEEESGSTTEPEQPEEDQNGDSTVPAGENTQAQRPWWLIVAGALAVIMGIGIFFVVRKKQEDD